MSTFQYLYVFQLYPAALPAHLTSGAAAAFHPAALQAAYAQAQAVAQAQAQAQSAGVTYISGAGAVVPNANSRFSR